MTKKLFEKVTIIGVGLIGGSLARGLKTANCVDEVIGFGRNLGHLQQAVDLKVIDRAVVSLKDAVSESELIVVAVPVGNMAEIFTELAKYITADTIITDVGSVKGSVVRDAKKQLQDYFPSFVPGHPIAGTENSGVAASSADLFSDHWVILTPDDSTNPDALARVTALWQAVNAQVVNMDVKEHDSVLAACSHLPHMLAFSLVDMLAQQKNHERIFDLAAGGFKDFTRIASSDPSIWRDICLANPKPIIKYIKAYQDNLGQLMSAIQKADDKALSEIFNRAKQARDNFFKSDND